MRHRILPPLILLLIFFVPVGVWSSDKAEIDPQLSENLPEGWYARIDTTMGRFVAQLLPEQAPQAVAQFVALAEGTLERRDPVTGDMLEGPYYDGTSVYRAEAGIRFEAGDPTGTGRGGPPLWVSSKEGSGPISHHGAGRLGLNLTPGRGASPYSFFVTASAQPQLSGRYPCFGTVVSGSDVVMRICGVKTHRNGSPIEPVLINRVRIFAVGDPPPLQEPLSYQGKPGRLAPRQPASED